MHACMYVYIYIYITYSLTYISEYICVGVHLSNNGSILMIELKKSKFSIFILLPFTILH